MAYNNFAEDLIAGLGQFSQGYMQGQREREDRAMRQQQFDQQQKMAGLQYDMAKQRESQQMALQKYADAAQAVLMGDYRTAKQLHNELGGNEVDSIEPIDNDNLRIRYSDGAAESIIPKTEYAQVVASRGNPERMINAINSIAQNQRMRDMAKTSAEAKVALEGTKQEGRAALQGERIAAKMADTDKRLLNQWKIALLRKSTASGGSRAQGQTAKTRDTENLANIYMANGEFQDIREARAKAANVVYRSGLSDAQIRREQMQVVEKALSDGGPEARKAARAFIADAVQGATEGLRGGKKTAPKASGGGIDFNSHGFQRDAKTGNWRNPNTGVYFRDNNGKAEAWSNAKKSWVPVQ